MALRHSVDGRQIAIFEATGEGVRELAAEFHQIGFEENKVLWIEQFEEALQRSFGETSVQGLPEIMLVFQKSCRCSRHFGPEFDIRVRRG
jgi:hypothetical protein